MDLSQYLADYQGQKVDLSQIGGYERWALGFFHQRDHLVDPNVELTLQLDITEAENNYRQKYSATAGSSLTVFLIWKLIRAQMEHREFLYRELEGQWYIFDNLPLFFPVAVGGESRFENVVIPDVNQMDWDEFCRAYRKGVESARYREVQFETIPEELWSIFNFIGNLPNLRFTSLAAHKTTRWTGRTIFYFGQRHQDYEGLKVPFYVCLDHCNTDPYIFSRLVDSYLELLVS